jgi:hypothetical protein
MATNGDMPPVQNEKVNTDIVTLTRFLTEEQAKHKEATGDFTYAYRPLQECFKMLIFLIQITLPCSPIFLQKYCILHPPSHAHQPHRSGRLL